MGSTIACQVFCVSSGLVVDNVIVNLSRLINIPVSSSISRAFHIVLIRYNFEWSVVLFRVCLWDSSRARVVLVEARNLRKW